MSPTKVVAITICERCGAAGQSSIATMDVWEDDPFGGGMRKRTVGEPRWGRAEIMIDEKRRLEIVALRMGGSLPDYPGERDDEVPLRLDLCPTCKFAFATWWLEGRKS